MKEVDLGEHAIIRKNDEAVEIITVTSSVILDKNQYRRLIAQGVHDILGAHA
jgi:hypothetical protein